MVKLSNKKLSEYVFTNPESKTRYYDVKRAFKTACTRASIVNLRFHDLRHSAATRMVSAGIDLIVVMDILGHENVKTTMRYAHPVPERKRQAVESIIGNNAKSKKTNKVVNLRS